MLTFQFLNGPDFFTANVYADHVRVARAGDVTGEAGARSMSLETFRALAAIVKAADPDGWTGAGL